MELLEPAALAATRAAALACQAWVGRGDPDRADAAATEAMREVLSRGPGLGTVVIGEGEKDAAPMLYDGERLGLEGGPEFEIAVDPLECTKLCARGVPGALATIAFGPPGSLWSPAPAFYMDKLVAPAGARHAIDIADEPEANVRRVGEALGRPLAALRVVVLDKPRHEPLIGALRDLGVSVMAPSDGDVAGALTALLPDGQADLLMGIGGTPEGVMTACAARALGGGMQARLAPQREDERRALDAAGVDVTRVLDLDELVSQDALFAATGVSGGLLRRPWTSDGDVHTESVAIAAGRVRRVVERSAAAPPGPVRPAR